jgi:hypothetical protein
MKTIFLFLLLICVNSIKSQTTYTSNIQLELLGNGTQEVHYYNTSITSTPNLGITLNMNNKPVNFKFYQKLKDKENKGKYLESSYILDTDYDGGGVFNLLYIQYFPTKQKAKNYTYETVFILCAIDNINSNNPKVSRRLTVYCSK